MRRWCLGVWVGVWAPHAALAAIEQQNRPPASPEEPAPAPVLTKAPELLEFVGAEYPPDLLVRGIGGEVLLLIDLDARGEVARVEVTHADDPAFIAPAFAAVTRFVFSPAEIDYAPAPIRIEYRYVFTPNVPEPDLVAGATAPNDEGERPLNVVGLVREAGVRRPIAGAVIAIGGLPVTETDAEGNFSIRGVPSGTFTLRISSPYHEAYEIEETLADDERLEAKYYLTRTSSDPFATTVRGQVEKREVSQVNLSRTELTKVPGTSGDPLRVVENLPGMARPPAGFGALLVRGANPSDSQVFLDGVEIPILYHFGGLTSVVPSYFLEEINFYPGGFGARYGRAIAGVVDVVSRDISCDLWRGEAQLSNLEGQIYSCAPISGWTVAAAARRSTVDFILPFILTQLIPRRPDQGVISATPAYLDYQVKAHREDGNQSIDVFAFGADDRLSIIQTGSFEDLNFDFGLIITWHRLLLRHRAQLGPDTTLSTSLAPGFTATGFEGGTADLDLRARSGIEAWSLEFREELKHRFSDDVSFAAGVDVQVGEGIFNASLPIPTDLGAFPTPTFDITAIQHVRNQFPIINTGVWTEFTWDSGFGLKVIPGLRVDAHSFNRVAHASIQPRLNARIEFLDGMLAAKAAYGWYEKMPEPQDLIAGIGNPRLVPLRAHQLIVGYEHKFTDYLDLDVQGFYTLRERLPTPSNRVVFEDGRAIEENYTSHGRGRSFGLEVLLRYKPSADGYFYGWIAYTLSQALRQDRARDATLRGQQGSGGPGPAEIPDTLTDEYPANFDQPHILTVVLQVQNLPWGLEAGARFRLVSGNPYTPIQNGRVYNDIDADLYDVDLSLVARNSARYPMFHQLDVRIDKTWTFDLWKLTGYIEILNVYNATNIEQYQYDYRYRARVGVAGLTFVPVFGLKGEF